MSELAEHESLAPRRRCCMSAGVGPAHSNPPSYGFHMTRRRDGRWNHNLHYHRVVLSALPRNAHTGLDIGTGNGLLAADLAGVVDSVTAIDVDAQVLDEARREAPRIEWVCGDVMSSPLPLSRST